MNQVVKTRDLIALVAVTVWLVGGKAQRIADTKGMPGTIEPDRQLAGHRYHILLYPFGMGNGQVLAAYRQFHQQQLKAQVCIKWEQGGNPDAFRLV